ncbi:unnamed protein product, partial [Choristocarpus tenellus]
RKNKGELEKEEQLQCHNDEDAMRLRKQGGKEQGKQQPEPLTGCVESVQHQGTTPGAEPGIFVEFADSDMSLMLSHTMPTSLLSRGKATGIYPRIVERVIKGDPNEDNHNDEQTKTPCRKESDKQASIGGRHKDTTSSLLSMEEDPDLVPHCANDFPCKEQKCSSDGLKEDMRDMDVCMNPLSETLKGFDKDTTFDISPVKVSSLPEPLSRKKGEDVVEIAKAVRRASTIEAGSSIGEGQEKAETGLEAIGKALLGEALMHSDRCWVGNGDEENKNEEEEEETRNPQKKHFVSDRINSHSSVADVQHMPRPMPLTSLTSVEFNNEDKMEGLLEDYAADFSDSCCSN